jgi:3-phenylpropionate/cinnamic acid dioxygenase small subunit
MSDVPAIARLIYRYAELIDAGEFEQVAELLRDARIIFSADRDPVTAEELLANFNDTIILYADGTPRTKHLVTNLDVEVDGDGTAVARSTYVVLQQVDAGPIQTIVAGRYLDRFMKVGNNWLWTERDYSTIDLIGDQSMHLRSSAPK